MIFCTKYGFFEQCAKYNLVIQVHFIAFFLLPSKKVKVLTNDIDFDGVFSNETRSVGPFAHVCTRVLSSHIAIDDLGSINFVVPIRHAFSLKLKRNSQNDFHIVAHFSKSPYFVLTPKISYQGDSLFTDQVEFDTNSKQGLIKSTFWTKNGLLNQSVLLLLLDTSHTSLFQDSVGAGSPSPLQTRANSSPLQMRYVSSGGFKMLTDGCTAIHSNFVHQMHASTVVVIRVAGIFIFSSLLCILDSLYDATQSRCLKITEKVSFNIASEASYVYILSGQKLFKDAKNDPF